MAGSESSGEKVARSANRLERSSERVEDSADRRTQLAADRTIFAAERTYAAWVRTGLVSLASGAGANKLLSGVIWHWLAVATGNVLILFSAFCFVAGVWRNLNPGAPPPPPDARELPRGFAGDGQCAARPGRNSCADRNLVCGRCPIRLRT